MKPAWVTTSTAVLICSAFHLNIARAEETTRKEIESIWQKTAIQQIACKISSLTWRESGIDPFDNQQEPQGWRADEEWFFRNASLGMKLEYGNYKCNLLNNVGCSTSLDSKQGFHYFRYEQFEQASIKSHAYVSTVLLNWLDPLSSEVVDFQSVQSSGFKVENDAKYGDVVRVQLNDKRTGVDKEYVLSKSCDWRIVESWSKENGVTIDRKEYRYDRTSSLLQLRSAKIWSYGPDGKLRLKRIFKFDSIKPKCSLEDLTLDLPPRCVVENLDGTKFLVNSDGTIRRILPEEKKIVKSYNELFDTPEGALLKPAGNR